MFFYISLFFFSFLLVIFLMPWVINWAKALGAIDRPGPRHPHRQPTPRLGGLSLWVGFWLTVLIVLVLRPEALVFPPYQLLALFIGSIIIIWTGISDDIKGMSPWKKLFWQIIAAVIVVAAGVKVEWLRNPFGAPIILGAWSGALSVFWIVFLINVINWLDGLDGLAAGISFIAAIVLFILSILVGQPSTSILALILAAAVFGLLFFNFYPAKIFLGDSGSMFLGFILACLALISGGKVTTLTLVLSIPILDFFWVVIRRILNKKSPTAADLGHLHHRFLATGLSERQTVLLMYIIAAIFGAAALLTETIGKLKVGFVALGAMFIIGLGLVIWNTLASEGKNQKKKLS